MQQTLQRKPGGPGNLENEMDTLYAHTFIADRKPGRCRHVVAVIFNALPGKAGQQLAAHAVVNRWNRVETCLASDLVE